MWIAYAVSAAFFLAILGIGWFAVQDRESEAARADAGGPGLPDAGACAVCDGAQPGRAATTDQVVFEVEHRIDAELRDIAHALHAHPDRLARIFHA